GHTNRISTPQGPRSCGRVPPKQTVIGRLQLRERLRRALAVQVELVGSTTFAVRAPLHHQPEAADAQVPVRLASWLVVVAAVVAAEARLDAEPSRVVDRDAQAIRVAQVHRGESSEDVDLL